MKRWSGNLSWRRLRARRKSWMRWKAPGGLPARELKGVFSSPRNVSWILDTCRIPGGWEVVPTSTQVTNTFPPSRAGETLESKTFAEEGPGRGCWPSITEASSNLGSPGRPQWRLKTRGRTDRVPSEETSFSPQCGRPSKFHLYVNVRNYFKVLIRITFRVFVL